MKSTGFALKRSLTCALAIALSGGCIETRPREKTTCSRVENRLDSALPRYTPPFVNPLNFLFSEACRIVADVAEGLAAAHEAGVIHRDIKPANILHEPSGRVKIIDFGNPRRIATDLAGAIVLGTPRYMSPEHCLGKPLSPASDFYSLGVVLMMLLTGGSPFSGSPREMMERHVRLAPPRLEDFGRPFPTHLERIVSRLLAKDPDARYASGRDLANDLHRRVALPLLHTQTSGGMAS